MRPAARKLLERILERGEAWVVPYQHKIVRELDRARLVVFTEERRHNRLRGGYERRVIAGPELNRARLEARRTEGS